MFAAVFYVIMMRLTNSLTPFGQHFLRMADTYIKAAYECGSANLVTGIILHFRAYDTLGEATVLVTAVLGVVTILRLHGKKKEN